MALKGTKKKKGKKLDDPDFLVSTKVARVLQRPLTVLSLK
jgi:hypothetical protein